MPDSAFRIAIIGCGAISEQGHLPAFGGVDSLRLAAMVDKDVPRAQRLAAKHAPAAQAVGDYRSLIGQIDAAIVALPPALHAPVSVDLLKQGIHVLVEKPMARTTAECDAMLAAARDGGALLAVGFVRRFRWSYRFARRIIESGALGKIQSFDVSEGGIFDWPIASPFFLDRQASGGGVLADAGVHAIDALQWWLGSIEAINYRDDDMGGVEADCELDVTMTGGVRGHIELSRTRAMRNTTILRGSLGTLELHAYTNDVTLSLHDAASLELPGSVKQHDSQNETIFADQLRDFAAAIRDQRAPMVDGVQGRQSVEVVERCYALRKPLRHAWVFEGVPLHDQSVASVPTTSPSAVLTAGGAR